MTDRTTAEATFGAPADSTPAFKGPAGLPLGGNGEARPLAVGDKVEWEPGTGTTNPIELEVLSKLRALASREGIVTQINQSWAGPEIIVNYSGIELFHRPELPLWGEALTLVRLSDGERF